ncbi:flagellar protein FlgN [Tissierella carlieri]|uniref:flagellar export chaperone FlgN n=1 Tax=Tissierella carlieri TaxID=689904 RepID=UPI001C0F8E85|nr:flagellar export chaperone FlgN [Tissierella carlieri]MBU5310795.1 flagellar protein FlgN [Tissierella carlieri]
MTYDNVKKMIELSLKKKDILIEILRLTTTQAETIENDNMDDLSKILIQKEKLIEDIDTLDRDFISLYNDIKSEEGIDNLEKINIEKYANIKSLKEIVTEINTILNDISMIDRNNTIKMKSNVDKVKSDLKQVKEVKRAYKGYNYEAVESILIDEKQ